MLKKFLSWILAVVFFIETTPDDLWHSLTGHHDTIDVYSAVTSVGDHHIHCKALQDFLPDFSKAEIVKTPAVFVQQISSLSEIYEPAAHLLAINAVGRAPPALG